MSSFFYRLLKMIALISGPMLIFSFFCSHSEKYFHNSHLNCKIKSVAMVTQFENHTHVQSFVIQHIKVAFTTNQ